MSLFNKIKLNNSKNLKLTFGLFSCFLKGFIIIFVGIILIALAYYKMSEKIEILFYLSYLFFALGGFVTGNSTHKKAGGRGIVVGTLGAIPLAMIFYIVLLIFNFNNISAFSILSPFVCMIGGTIGGIVSSNSKKIY